MAYIYDLTDTWSAAGTVFNGIKLNVTNTASASGSKLVTLQIGGTEHFSVTKDGVGYFSGNVGIGTSSPAQKLSVSGNIVTAGEVALSGADFVYSWAGGTTGQRRAGFYLDGTNQVVRVYTAQNEVARFDASGNVGIGTSSAGAKLTVIGSGSKLYVDLSGDNYYDAANHVFRNFAGSERARIDSSGSLLVGTTSNSLSGTATTFVVNYSGGATHGCNFNQTVSSATYYTQIAFSTAGTVVGEIRSNNTATQYNTSSDARLKHDIAEAPEASSLIDAIQVRSFKWNADNSEQRYGFVAQELIEVAPEAVSQPADPDAMMGVDYSKLVPMLVKEIQSMRLRLAQLEGN